MVYALLKINTTTTTDDTQLYISFTPTNSALSLDPLTTIFTDILSWMNLNKLLLNPSKTEFLLIGTKQQCLKFSDLTNLSHSNDIISQFLCSQSWLHLWLWHVFLWSNQLCIQILSFSHPRHSSNSSSSSSIYSHSSCKFSSKLDYCNSLYSGISQANLNKLQRIQNSLACVTTNISKYQHITPILKNLHWLYWSNKESITNSSQMQNTYKSTTYISPIVFHFRHILFLHDLLIHLFFPFHMSDRHLVKGRSLSSVHDFGIHSLLIPETRLLYQYSIPGSKHTSSKLCSIPRLFPISLDCLPGFWFLLFSFYALSNDT